MARFRFWAATNILYKQCADWSIIICAPTHPPLLWGFYPVCYLWDELLKRWNRVWVWLWWAQLTASQKPQAWWYNSIALLPLLEDYSLSKYRWLRGSNRFWGFDLITLKVPQRSSFYGLNVFASTMVSVTQSFSSLRWWDLCAPTIHNKHRNKNRTLEKSAKI